MELLLVTRDIPSVYIELERMYIAIEQMHIVIRMMEDAIEELDLWISNAVNRQAKNQAPAISRSGRRQRVKKLWDD